MKVINNDWAYTLERLVRKLYDCERLGVMGMADADYLARNPLDAAKLIFAPLFKNDRSDRTKIVEFFHKYANAFDECKDSASWQSLCEEYTRELEALVKSVYKY